jgi:hypothetical protein
MTSVLYLIDNEHTCTLAELLEANEECFDDDEVAALRALAPGMSLEFGGGAWATFIIRAVTDNESERLAAQYWEAQMALAGLVAFYEFRGEFSHGPCPDVIAIARRHVDNGAPMESSARLCLADAVVLNNHGEIGRARGRALRSLAYSIGVHHPDYKIASSLCALRCA